MGHLTNPIGFRIGRTVGWSSGWAVDSILYKQCIIKEESIKWYLHNFFEELPFFFRRNGFILSHVTLLKQAKRYLICLYLYSANLVYIQHPRFLFTLNLCKTTAEQRTSYRFKKRKFLILKRYLFFRGNVSICTRSMVAKKINGIKRRVKRSFFNKKILKNESKFKHRQKKSFRK